MGSKYSIVYSNYEDKFSHEYQTQWLIKAIIKFIYVRLKYNSAGIQYRKP